MNSKSTSDMTNELMSSSDINSYIKENKSYFTNQSITEPLQKLFKRGHHSKAALARKSGISEVYLHQVFSGRRHPSRDRLLCICAALEVSLEESQYLLKLAGYAPLYPKNRRDAIIMFGLAHKLSPENINGKLSEESQNVLF